LINLEANNYKFFIDISYIFALHLKQAEKSLHNS